MLNTGPHSCNWGGASNYLAPALMLISYLEIFKYVRQDRNFKGKSGGLDRASSKKLYAGDDTLRSIAEMVRKTEMEQLKPEIVLYQEL